MAADEEVLLVDDALIRREFDAVVEFGLGDQSPPWRVCTKAKWQRGMFGFTNRAGPHDSQVWPTYRRSAAGARATAKPTRRARLLQRLVSRPRGLLVNSNNGDPLVSELSDEFKGTTERVDVTTERRNLAVFKIGTSLKARDISLIDLGLLSDVGLGFPDGITQGSQSEMDASRGAKTS